MAVFRREGDALALQQRVDFGGVCCGMDAGEDDLVLADQTVLAGLEFLHLGDEVGPGIDLFHRADQFRAGFFVSFIRKAAALARALLHQGRVSVGDDRGDLAGRGDGTVFAVFDVLQKSENHGNLLL